MIYDDVIGDAVLLTEKVEQLFAGDDPVPGNRVLRLIKLQEALLSFLEDEK